MMSLWQDKLIKIEPYVPGEQSVNKNIIKLNANENPYPPSPNVIEAIKKLNTDKLRLYPSSNCFELRDTLANYYGLDIEQVFTGNGSDDVLALCFMAFFNSKKPIVFPDITYSFYTVWCSLFNVPYKMIPLTNTFNINPKDYYCENGGVILPNPNAPTGISEGKQFIEEILDHNKDVIVIIDEAYVDFGGYSCVELLKKYDNLLIIHTFSKSRSLAGMRIGTALGNKELIQTLDAVKNSYNSYPLDSIALAAGIASVKDDVYFKQTLNKIINTRERISSNMKNLGFKVCPSHSNFIFVTHPTINANILYEYLRKNNIYVRYFNLPRIDNYLRITIGTDEDMDKLLYFVKNYSI